MAEGKKNVVAFIPARGGSVSIPLKNIKELAGRPLIDWCIRSALDSGVFSEVYVSTDHDGVAKVAEKCGAKVHWRAAETATSTASTESAMVDFTTAHQDYDILCLIQATSPLTTPEHFKEALQLFEKKSADSLVTAVRAHRFMWKVGPSTNVASAKNYEPTARPRRQDWEGELIENGAFYFTRKALFEESKCRLGGKMVLYEMPEHTLVELDSMVDWEIMKALVTEHGHKPQAISVASLDAAPEGAVEIKVTLKKPKGFYIGAAVSFLKGVEAKAATEDKPAVEAKAAVDAIRITGLGEACNVALAAAAAVESEGVGAIVRFQTDYPSISGKTCPQVLIDLKRK